MSDYALELIKSKQGKEAHERDNITESSADWYTCVHSRASIISPNKQRGGPTQRDLHSQPSMKKSTTSKSTTATVNSSYPTNIPSQTFSWASSINSSSDDNINNNSNNTPHNNMQQEETIHSMSCCQSPLSTSKSSDMYSQIHAAVLLLIDSPLFAEDPNKKEEEEEASGGVVASITAELKSVGISSGGGSGSTSEKLNESHDNAWSKPRNHAQHLSSTSTTTKPAPQSKPTPKPSSSSSSPEREEEDYVYLLPKAYLQNWLLWSYNSYYRHSSFSSDVQRAFIKASKIYNIDFVNDNRGKIINPGVIHALSLGVRGAHGIVELKKNVKVLEPYEEKVLVVGKEEEEEMVERYGMFDMPTLSNDSNTSSWEVVEGGSGGGGGMEVTLYEHREDTTTTTTTTHPKEGEEKKEDVVYCCAVPEPFYELLRSVNGVLCDDGVTVTKKPVRRRNGSMKNVALHHHVIPTTAATPSSSSSEKNISKNSHHSPKSKTSPAVLGGSSSVGNICPRPIEFRRKVITVSSTDPDTKSNFTSPASKLLKMSKEQQENVVIKRKVVEVHPIKLIYSIVGARANSNQMRTSTPPDSPCSMVTSNGSSSGTSSWDKDTITLLAGAASKMKKDKETQNGKDAAKRQNGKKIDSEQRTQPANSKKPQQQENTVVQNPLATYPPNGSILVSGTSSAYDALQAVLNAAVPNIPGGCARIWSNNGRAKTLRHCKTMGATAKGDGFELVDMDHLQGKDDVQKSKAAAATKKVQKESSEEKTPLMSVEEWVQKHSSATTEMKDIEILVEVRNEENVKWSREDMELANRIKVGDFVDAQDSTGQWYESIIRDVKDDFVKVHYIGWSSRWDVWVPRRKTEKILPNYVKNVHPPAPLWSRTLPWRDTIAVGDKVEVREAASIVQRPKWFRAVVRAVAKEDEELREIVGGAELETFEEDEQTPSVGNEEKSEAAPTKKRHLLLLNRTRQVMVEVPQEKLNSYSAIPSPKSPPRPASSTDTPPYPTAKPPTLRWVDLYGEEICGITTHLEPETNVKPATISYAMESSRPPVEVMKTHMHGAGFVRESIKGVPPAPGSVGLHNLGNSCFLNSVLQCLNHIEPLTRYFLKGDFKKDLNQNNPLGSGGNVAVAYSSLLSDMWGGEYSALAPRTLKQTVANFAPQFNNLYQHDSQEFCSFLLDGLHEDLNRVRDKPYVEDLEAIGMTDEKAAMESWRKHLLRHDSIIVDTCQGMHRSHLRCPKCGKESVKYDVYSTISLPLAEKKNGDKIPLSECLDNFSSKEELDEENTWYCSNCKENVCAMKEISLWNTPDILIFHLKRFTFDTCKRKGGLVRSKVDDTVDFPVDGLDMRPYILGPVDNDAPPIYKLFGVSEHLGSTANSGHYTATVRNSKDGKWYRCNDSHVGSTFGEAAITKGAYLLFYQRAKGQSRWAGMEKAMTTGNIDPYNAMGPDVDGFIEVKSKRKKKKTPTASLNKSNSGPYAFMCDREEDQLFKYICVKRLLGK